MDFIYTFVIINLLIWIPWLWVFKIKPYLKKRAFNKWLEKHPQYYKIHETNVLLTKLYTDNKAYHISRKDIKRLKIENDDFIYGEINFLSFFKILEIIKPRSKEIFYDLGSGSGKAVFAAALFFDLEKIYGIEMLPGLYKLATEQIKKAETLIKLHNNGYYKKYKTKLSRIKFINENFLNYPICNADIVYINATCMGYLTWDKIVEKLSLLKIGSRVIVNTKKIQHEAFKLIHESRELMSWGDCSVKIYIKSN